MAITGGSNLNSVPTTQKQTLSTNYLDLRQGLRTGRNNMYRT